MQNYDMIASRILHAIMEVSAAPTERKKREEGTCLFKALQERKYPCSPV